MTDMHHTPVMMLPWIVVDGSVEIRVNDEFSFWLGGGFGGRSGRPRPDLEGDRDAILRLAAAAPDLLKALLALVERNERTGRDTANTLDLELTKKARAVIAKAKGESQ